MGLTGKAAEWAVKPKTQHRSILGSSESRKIEIGSKINQLTATGYLRALFVHNCTHRKVLAVLCKVPIGSGYVPIVNIHKISFNSTVTRTRDPFYCGNNFFSIYGI